MTLCSAELVRLDSIGSNLGERDVETMNIALPESMKSFVQEQVTAGGYSSVSEYVRDLIRADQRRQVDDKIDALLLEGLSSGDPIEVTPEYWESKKRKLTERLSKAKAGEK